MVLRYSLDLTAEADDIEAAVDRVLFKGLRTADLGGGEASLGCTEMTDAVLAEL